MAKLLADGKKIGFTILPYYFDTPIQEELLNHHSDYALGYVTYTKETGKHSFTYTESGFMEVNDHWSLEILKEFPYCEKDWSWIVYSCSPEKTRLEFGKILSSETLHIYNWDTWSVDAKESTVAVVTSLDIF
jgi:hypothetical protein